MNICISLLDDASRLSEVFALYRKFSGTLGNMPRGGFEEAIAKGNLIIAKDDAGHLLGYVLYRITNRMACVAHVCVRKEARGRKVANRMLDHLKQASVHLDGIKLKCRNDYDAHRFWPRMGFVARGTAVGRGCDAAAMTLWHYSHNPTDLFTDVDTGKPKVVIDANVFFDLILPSRPNKEMSEALTVPWIDDIVELSLTPELYNDINRSKDPAVQEISRAKATSFHEIKAGGIQVEQIADQLKRFYPDSGRLSERDASDIRHMAYAIAAGEKYFVTRDQGILAKAPEVLQQHDLHLLSPIELVSHLDVIQREQEYQPRRLGASTTHVQQLKATDKAVAEGAFRMHPGEKLLAFRSLLDSALADPKGCIAQVAYDGDGKPGVLIATRQQSASTLELPLLRLAAAPLATTILRNLLMNTVISAARDRAECVRLTDPRPSREVIAALEELGFTQTASGWVKLVMKGFQDLPAVAERLESLGLPNGTLETGAEIDSLGTLIWPGKLECPTITCYLIPIEAQWAEHFFDIDLAASRIPGLSGIREDLHLGVEGVYYSGSNVGMKAPGIILWYVSKGSEGLGSMQVKAMSRLREVVRDTPKALFRRFSRLGVYAWKDVFAAAKEDLDANLTALRFSHTELFAKPLEKEQLCDFNIAHPYGPRVIPFATFRQIYNHAFPNSP